MLRVLVLHRLDSCQLYGLASTGFCGVDSMSTHTPLSDIWEESEHISTQTRHDNRYGVLVKEFTDGRLGFKM